MWSNKYIGIPYKQKGRDFDGIDCWGLVRLIYKEEYNVQLPSFVNDYTEDDTIRIQDLVAQYKEGWEQLDEPQEGCVVLFRILGTESHIGVAISSTQFIHAREKYTSAVESFDSTAWKNRVIGYFKYTEKSSTVLNIIPHPLRTERFTLPVVTGTTLEELAGWAVQHYNIAPELKSKTIIMVNGRVVEEAMWPTTILKNTDTIEYRAVATGGGGNIFKLVAILAIAVFAPEIVAYLGNYGAVAEMSAVQVATEMMGATAFKLATIGVSLVGSLLVNAIAPVRPPAEPNDPGSSERQLMVTGAANQAYRYGAIPVILGRVKITPPLGANSFITYQNERDTYLNMLLVWGYGPLNIETNTLKVGDVSINDFTFGTFSDGSNKLITLDRKTTPTATQQFNFDAIYGSDITQISKNLTLVCDGNPEGATVSTGSVDDDGVAITTTVMPNPGAYTEVASTEAVNSATVIIHFPQGLRKVKIKGDGAGDDAATTVTLGYGVKIGTGAWTDWKKVTYGRDAPKKDAFTVTETYDIGSLQNIQIRVRRETGDNTDDNPDWRYAFESVLVGVTFTKNSAPTADPKNCTIAKTALQLKASEQLSGSVEGINAIVQTYCLVWNGTAWVYGTTSNPAALYRYVLQHPANPQRILDSEVSTRLNLTEIQRWYEYCDQNRSYTDSQNVTSTYKLEYNGIMASQRSVLDTLRDICAAGRASPSLMDGKWSVIIDEAKSNIVQHFTPHNSWGFESTRALPHLPDALRINYYDQDQDYQEAEVIVPTIGKTATTAELFETISLPGVTKVGAVVDHAKWHLAQALLRREVYTINTDIEYIVCNRGDRVKVTHDVPMWGLASGRIKNRITDSIFELSEVIPMSNTVDYTIRFRSSSGASNERTVKKSFTVSTVLRANNIVTIGLNAQHPLQVGDTVIVASNVTAVNTTIAKITAVTTTGFSYSQIGTSLSQVSAAGTVSLADGYYSKIQVTSTITSTDANSGDLFLFGQYQKEAQDLIIMGIEPTSNKTARITLVDYGVTSSYNIFTDYKTLSSNTIFESNITKPPVLQENAFEATDIPVVTNIQSNDLVADLISPGTYAYKIKVSFVNSKNIALNTAQSVNPLPNTVASVECQYVISSATNSGNYKSVVAPFLSNTVNIPNVIVGETYKLRLRYVSTDGRVGPWGTWNTHTVIGKLYNYGEVASVSIKRIGRFLEMIPTFGTNAPVPDDFKYYEIRVLRYQTPLGTLPDIWSSTDPDLQKVTTTSVGRIDLKQFPVTASVHRMSATGVQYVVACRALDNVGNYSATTAKTALTLTTIPA